MRKTFEFYANKLKFLYTYLNKPILYGDTNDDPVLLWHTVQCTYHSAKSVCIPEVVINYTSYATLSHKELMKYWLLMFEYFRKIIVQVLMAPWWMFKRCDCVIISYCQPISFQNMLTILYEKLKIQSFAWIRVTYYNLICHFI